MVNLLGLTMDELKAFATEMGEKPFRGKQLFVWINRGAGSFQEMTDLPKSFREKLEETAYIGLPQLLDMQVDKADGTRKFLWGFPGPDGEPDEEATVESVFMKYKYGNSLCVSSQIGCRMGCGFCASALGGFVRNLTSGEMLGQVLAAERETKQTINHIVVMGMGEPFDNYDALSGFLKLLHDPAGKNMSYRNMTVSTSGLVPGIRKFAADFPQAGLAISLHRLTDEGRSAIMPVNRRYPLTELLGAAREYTQATGRRITFEYALIRGENDSDQDVQLMIQKLRGMLCHVNLIPLNDVKETGFKGSGRARANQIAEELNRSGISATVRRELGSDIDGACGQLRLHSKK
ncbi:MAG: 23S rRNA (adenine(2503)-C(2))-methyltransferase RlmN [Bacillota bacterium]|nr:23S rRNA (adenine(2503)-C(2))-methyltransferase RlmN [Bacillota bacterium]